MNGRRFDNKVKKNGFYLALAVCLVAVGIAGWSTYDAVNSYLDDDAQAAVQSGLIQQQDEDVRSGQEQLPDVRERESEASENEDPERLSSLAAAEAEQEKEESSSRAQEKPKPSPSPESAPVAAQPVQTENTGVLYEISTAFIPPVASEEVQSAYSAGAPVYSETMKDWRIHEGTDYTAEANEEVKACANGRVMELYTDAFLGNVMVIEHGEYLFYYCGIGETPNVAQGDIVTKGQTVAVVTAVPYETAEQPHIHLEVKRDEVYLDPHQVISGQM